MQPDPTPKATDAMGELVALAREIRDRIGGDGEPEGLAPGAAARFLGISTSLLHSLNLRGLIPEPVHLSERAPRWSRTELKAWLLAGSPSRVRWAALRDSALRRTDWTK